MRRPRSRLPSRLFFKKNIIFLCLSQFFSDNLLTAFDLCDNILSFAAVASIARDGFA